MEDECKVQLDASVDTQDSKQTMQGVKLHSKLTTALLVFALCLNAAAATAVLVFNRHTKGPGQDENNFDMHHTLRQISNVRAAIHLQGEYNSNRKDSVEWKNQVDQSHSEGLKLDNNEIIIPHSGLYFVYSQASFRVSCSSHNDDAAADDHEHDATPMVHLSHTVKRWSSSYGNEETKRSYYTILHSVRTACQKTESSNADEPGSWFSAIYMGAVFNLKEGDRLKTEMGEKMLLNLEDEPGKTFFGVFAL